MDDIKEEMSQRGITAKDGLLWENGKIVELPKADMLAFGVGLACAEELVRHLSEQSKEESK